MARPIRDRDNVSSGRTLHTYTPRSHEDLLRSHLQLDATRNARLQNELQRLADENKKLKNQLNNAQKDLKDQENEIDDLKKKLREKPVTPSSPRHSTVNNDPNRVFEIDGKPVTLDQIINHFEGVIQKHHDLLDRKNQRIQDLEDALANRPATKAQPSRRNAETQISPKEDPVKTDDLAKEIALVRKEYEQIEHILTDRNNKLENLIEDLRQKLDQYADEIARLRKQHAAQNVDPTESTMKLLKEKEKENDYLKDVINDLKNQPQNVKVVESTNEELEYEIKKIIEDKKNAVKKLSNMIIDLKKTPSGTMVKAPDKAELENECNEMMDDLNKMNDKLNNLLEKVKKMPQSGPVNTEDLLANLHNLKNQNEDQIEALKRQLKHPSQQPSQTRNPLRQSDPSQTRYPLRQSDPSQQIYPSHYPDPTPESSLKSYRPVEYRSVTPEVSFRQVPVIIREKPKGRLYPEIPSETHSIPPKPRKHSPVSCEACQEEDYIPSRKSHEKLPHPGHPAHPAHPDKPKKKGCCGGKGSKTSNVPYEKSPDRTHEKSPDRTHEKSPERGSPHEKSPGRNAPRDKSPDEEEVVYIHHPDQEHAQRKNNRSPASHTATPENSPKPKRKLIAKLKPDRH